MKESISGARSVHELLDAHHELGKNFAAFQVDWEGIRELAASVQQIHDLIVQQAIRLAIESLREQGCGNPPCRFAWLVMGSGARGEQTLWTDQDNALIFDPGEMAAVDAAPYFERFAAQVVQNLADAGYPLCQGYVMATNPRWRGAPADWQLRVSKYLSYPDWDNVRFLLIAADMRPVAGDVALGFALHEFIVEQISAQPYVLWMAADHGLEHKVALSLFNRFQPELLGEHKGEVNLKEGMHSQLTHAIRVWAIAHRISESSSFARIEKLEKDHIWRNDYAQQIFRTLQTSLTFRFRNPSNYVKIDNIEQEGRELLLRAFKETRHLQTFTAKHFTKPGG